MNIKGQSHLPGFALPVHMGLQMVPVAPVQSSPDEDEEMCTDTSQRAKYLLSKLKTMDSEQSEKRKKRKFEIFSEFADDDDDDLRVELQFLREATRRANAEYPENAKKKKLEEKLAQFQKIESELSELVDELEDECK
jgi:hypothetical protein